MARKLAATAGSVASSSNWNLPARTQALTAAGSELRASIFATGRLAAAGEAAGSTMAANAEAVC